MANLKQIRERVETTQTIEDITQALGDIATMKLRKIRKIIEHNIGFYGEISTVYQTVKMAGLKERKKEFKRQANGRTVCLLLTSNSSFYGGLDTELTNFFVLNTQNLNCDRVILGTAGKDLLSNIYYPHELSYHAFKSDSPTMEEIKTLAKELFIYSKVLVFHTKFVTVLNQSPVISDISELTSDKGANKEEKYFYILEPEIDKMINFFQNQISVLLFQAIFSEIDLARTAARMISMNQAEENARNVLIQEKRELINLKKQLVNIQTIETYANLHQTKF